MAGYVPDFQPTGRLCVRQTPGGFITMGVLHYPRGFRPEEGTGYPLMVANGLLTALPVAMTPLPPEQEAGSLGDWASSPMWSDVGAGIEGASGLMVRHVKAFDSGWALVGVSRKDPFEGVAGNDRFADGPHYWVDVDRGAVSHIAAPVPDRATRGTAVSQLYTNFPVWPGADGREYTLPTLTRAARMAMSVGSKLLELQVAGDLQEEQVARIMREVPGLYGLGGSHRDEQYLEFLRAIAPYNFPKMNDPVAKVDFERSECFNGTAVAAMLAGQLEHPAVKAALRLTCEKGRYEAAPDFLQVKNWAHEAADGLATTNWAMDANGRVVAAQERVAGEWSLMTEGEIARLQQSLSDAGVGLANPPEGAEITKVLSLGLMLHAHARKAESEAVLTNDPSPGFDR